MSLNHHIRFRPSVIQRSPSIIGYRIFLNVPSKLFDLYTLLFTLSSAPSINKENNRRIYLDVDERLFTVHVIFDDLERRATETRRAETRCWEIWWLDAGGRSRHCVDESDEAGSPCSEGKVQSKRGKRHPEDWRRLLKRLVD
jgi:hypothetical protein